MFPAIAATHPELAPTLLKLEQDHGMIAHLLAMLQVAAEKGLPPNTLESHLDVIAAIMESHFRYEERELLAVLDTVR
ncbi:MULTISPECIES: hemerythrin domain-containing protein [Mumia]|uniref:Hemerythrin domain-containing protein n=1 Tax=Mumia xiangluensis TaxID=1678900 RepID=A0ABW1QPY1_9ACTN|nr:MULTISPECIES: hemerythrin domain-containing protein [Mumia]